MAVTIVKKQTLKEMEKEKEDTLKLLWLKMLRRMIVAPEKGKSKNTWQEMDPFTCKVYITIWGMVPDPGSKVLFDVIQEYNQFDKTEFQKAVNTLIELELIEVGPDSYVQILYHLTPHEMGVNKQT